MHLALALSLLSAPATTQQSAAQEPAATIGPSPAGDDALEWKRLDGVALEVDERMVTWRDFAMVVNNARERMPIQTQSELQQLYAEVTSYFLRQSLGQQGGAEMELPREQLDAVLAQRLEEARDPVGALGHGAALRSRGLDPLAELEATRLDAFRVAWENEALGRQGLGVERPRIDRFVRPGQLRAIFEQTREIDASPEVRLQVLDVSGQATGSLEAARELVESIRAELDAGAEFEELFDLYAVRFRETLGMQPPVRAIQLEDDELREFATTAERGDLSGVLPYRLPGSQSGEPAGYRLVRLVSREAGEGELPDFEDPAFQRRLRDTWLEEEDRRRLAEASADRLARSHVWIHPALEAAGPPGGR